MATAVVTTDQQAKVPVVSGKKLAAMIPTDVDQAYRLSRAIAQSGMAPKAYGTDPNKILVGILAGMEVGLAPFAALQSIAVIGNNPAIWGDGALALVQASGLLVDMEETCDGNKAVCRVNRKDRATAIVREFSMDDAKKAGLAGKSGPWSQYPRRMLQMRARAFALRDGFADVLKGLGIAEEVRDFAIDGGALRAEPISGQALLEQARDDTPPSPAAAGDLEDADDAGPANTETQAAGASEPGPDDSQRGEVVTLESAKAEVDAAEIVADVNARVSALLLYLPEAEQDQLRSHALERIDALKVRA
jgi:hypothetical protein